MPLFFSTNHLQEIGLATAQLPHGNGGWWRDAPLKIEVGKYLFILSTKSKLEKSSNQISGQFGNDLSKLSECEIRDWNTDGVLFNSPTVKLKLSRPTLSQF